MSSRAQSRDLPRLLPYNFYAAILDKILRFAALSQDDRVACYPGPYYSFPGPTISSRAPLCHPERSRGISRVYCLTTSTLQSWIRSFGSLCSLRMTGWGVIPGLTISSRVLLCHPERSRGISRVYCLITSTPPSWIRSFGSLHSLMTTELKCYPSACSISQRSHVDPLRSIRARL